MDNKGAWRDKIFIEQFWRTVKYEEAYLRAYEIVSESPPAISLIRESKGFGNV